MSALLSRSCSLQLKCCGPGEPPPRPDNREKMSGVKIKTFEDSSCNRFKCTCFFWGHQTGPPSPNGANSCKCILRPTLSGGQMMEAFFVPHFVAGPPVNFR